MIKSPGFPGLYPINRDCDWTIRTQAGNRFNIHFYTLQLENSEDCEHDYLAVNIRSSFNICKKQTNIIYDFF